MTNRNLDIAVARLRGLEVYESHDDYLRAGFPHATEWSSAVQYPAYWFEPHRVALTVPFYSKDHNLAIEALEQVCDEHGLMPEMYRDNEWHVKLSAAIGIAHGHSKSLALAICRALGKLEK